MGQSFYLMEHDEYGDEAAAVIVDRQGKLVLEDIWNGFDDITIEQFQEAAADKHTLTIYQLGDSDEAVKMRFMNYAYLQSQGFAIETGQHNAVYTGPMQPGETLEDIYTRFNLPHPEGYLGHSLSVSDVVVLHSSSADTAYFVDSFGFKEIPDFFGQAIQQNEESSQLSRHR